MSITSQYIEAARKMQENWFSAVDAMTSQFAQKLERPAVPNMPVDPRKALDEVYDFYFKALQVQRETAHKMLDANMHLSEQWGAQAEHFYSAWREQAQTATDMARHQIESLTSAARDQALNVGEAVETRVAEASASGREQADRFLHATAEGADRVAEMTKQQSDAAAQATEETTEAAKEQTKRNYNLMNTAQLKSELTARGLDTEGSLDELRARLRENDDA